MCLLGLMGIYFILESSFMKYRPLMGHASGIVVGLGILVSFFVWLKIHNWNQDPDHQEKKNLIIGDLQFNPETFFHFLLPLIIFPSGYNMRRKKFFKNFKTIIWFGFCGSFLCFLFYYAMLYFSNSHKLLLKWDDNLK